jgi:ornithine cyclodeaminase
MLCGTVILNDGSNGKPLALLNGAKLTAVRTAAVGSTGVRHTSPKEASTLGVIGAGVQGFHQIIFACHNRPIKKVYIYDPFQKDLNSFVKGLKSELKEIEIKVVNGPEAICENSEIIITATNATSPVLPDNPKLLEGKSIIAIGSYKPEMIELPDSLYPLLDNYFIDVDMAIEESGDLIHPINKGLIDRKNIKLLSAVIKNDIKINPHNTSLYKSVGMALFDLYAAKYIYEKAKLKGVGELVNF